MSLIFIEGMKDLQLKKLKEIRKMKYCKVVPFVFLFGLQNMVLEM